MLLTYEIAYTYVMFFYISKYSSFIHGSKLSTLSMRDFPIFCSKLTCMHFSSWDNNKEWSVNMPKEEEIHCVVLGEGWLAVATSARYVRLFSLAGVQNEMFTIPGPVVCMAAHATQLMLIYHAAMGNDTE